MLAADGMLRLSVYDNKYFNPGMVRKVSARLISFYIAAGVEFHSMFL